MACGPRSPHLKKSHLENKGLKEKKMHLKIRLKVHPINLNDTLDFRAPKKCNRSTLGVHFKSNIGFNLPVFTYLVLPYEKLFCTLKTLG